MALKRHRWKRAEIKEWDFQQTKVGMAVNTLQIDLFPSCRVKLHGINNKYVYVDHFI